MTNVFLNILSPLRLTNVTYQFYYLGTSFKWCKCCEDRTREDSQSPRQCRNYLYRSCQRVSENVSIFNLHPHQKSTCVRSLLCLCVCVYQFRLQLVRNQGEEKPLELEMGWLCEATNFTHALVPAELVAQADKEALAAVGGIDSVEAATEEKTAVMDIET